MFFKNIFWILNNTSLRLASLQDGRLDPRRLWPPPLLASRHLAGGDQERGFALFSKSTVLLVLFHIFLSSKIIRLGFGSSFQCLGSGFLFCTGWIRFFSNGGVFLLEGLRYVGLVLFEKGLNPFSSSEESSFWPPVISPAVADLSFRTPLVMANDGVGSYGWFNFQNIWSMCFRRPLLPIVVEHYVLLLPSPRLWSLVEIVILVDRCGEAPWRWSSPVQGRWRIGT